VANVMSMRKICSKAPMETVDVPPGRQIAAHVSRNQWAGTKSIAGFYRSALQYMEQQNNNASSDSMKIVRPESTLLGLGCGLGVFQASAQTV
jgi:hypothetical protein